MTRSTSRLSRRHFLQGAAATAAAATLPRHVLGGPGQVPPSETLTAAVIGCGGQSGEDLNSYITKAGGHYRLLARCDVKFLDRADNKMIYADFRRVLERKDIDVISVATPPHWHALISIAAMQAGKDVLCEKPMTKYIAEGRAVVRASQRYRRVFQIGTGGRFGACQNPNDILTRKIMRSGLLKKCDAVFIKRGGFHVRRYCGRVDLQPEAVPPNLDWDMYCGPAVLRPFHPHRFGWSHRYYWDYEGGGLADFGQHYMDPFQWTYGKDDTSPVEIQAFAPPAHPEVAGMWSWVEMKYADGLTLVFDSGEWGEPYNRQQPRGVSLNDLDEEGQKKLAAMPEPEPLLTFVEAVRTRREAGGHAEAAHRAATILHLANISIRMGRKIEYDPVEEQIIDDEEANRLVNQPMRAPWHL
jgi:predicted dehydrogenase